MLIKNSFIYFFSSLISAGVSLFLIPIFANYLSLKEYGIYGFFIVLNGIFFIFIHSNLPNLLSRNFYENKQKDELIGAIIFYYFTSFLVISGVILIVGKFFLTYFNLNLSIISLLIVNVLALLKALNELYFNILRLNFFAKRFFFENFILILVRAILSYIFLLKFGWIGIFIGMAVSELVFCFYVFKYLRLKFNKDFFKESFMFVIKYFPTTINWRIITLSDRFFIIKMIGADSLGLYTLAFQLSSAFNLFINSLNQAWMPYFMKNILKEKKTIRKYIVVLVFIVGIFLFLGYLLLPFALRLFFKEEYLNSLSYLKWFLFILFFSFLHSIFSKYFIFYKKDSKISIFTTIGAVLNLFLNFVFIEFYGGIGALIATFLVYLLIVVLEIIYLLKEKYV